MANAPESKSLGRYQLLFMLGQGGMGEVHLAKLTGAAGFEKLCIVKTILPQMQADPQFVERFQHEARVLIHLNHSNIAQVYDMGEHESTLYMAIEYVPGVDLSRVESRVSRQEAIMPVPIALFLGQQINEALGYAHRKTGPDGSPLGIVHRDVSPQNVMVSYEGEVKVIDFGLAKSTVRSQRTLPSTVMGKLGYMSPEQASAKQVDHRSDIFSSGIVLWELLAGQPLYGGGTMGEMVAQMANPNIPSLRTIRPEISPTLDQIVMRALQVDPAARYSRADEFARALNELAVREGLTVGSEEVGNYVRAMCPEEFAAERQLQSKLSVLRKRTAPTEEVLAAPPGVEGTFLRPSQSPRATDQLTPAQRALSVVEDAEAASPVEVDPNPGRGRTVVAPRKSLPPVPPLKPAPAKGRTVVAAQPPKPLPAQPEAQVDAAHDDEPIIAPRSNGPLIGAIVVVLLVIAGGAGWYFTHEPEPVVKPPPIAAVEPKHTPEPVAVVDTGASAVVDVQPKQPDPQPAANDGDEKPALGLIEVNGTPYAVRIDDGDAILLLSKGQKPPFQEGDSALLVSMPEGATKVPLYARGAVIDVKPTLVKVAFNEGKVPTSGVKLFVMKDKVAVVKKAPVKEPAKDPVATKDPVKAEPTTVATKEPSKQPAKDPVKEPAKEPAKVDAPPPTPAAEVKKAIAGAIGISPANSTGGQIVRIQNTGREQLTNCTIRLTSNRTGTVTYLNPGAEVRMRYVDFKQDARPADPNFAQGWSAVYCHEGTGYFYTTWMRR